MTSYFSYRSTFPLASPYRRNIGLVGTVLYIFVLGLLGIFVVSLPFIQVPITVKASGTIRSGLVSPVISPAVDGTVLQNYVAENQKVVSGDTLAILDRGEQDVRTRYSAKQIDEAHGYIQDIAALLSAIDNQLRPKVVSAKYQAIWRAYYTTKNKGDEQLNDARQALARISQLYASRAVTLSEYEQAEHRYALTAKDNELIVDDFKVSLQNDMQHYKSLKESSETQRDEGLYSFRHFVILAPVDGYIHGLQSIIPGSKVYAGQNLGVISPTGEFLVYCMVRSRDMQLLKVGQSVNFKLDSYNTRVLAGKIIDMANDVVEIDGGAFYQITCNIITTPRVALRNGLVLRAAIKVGERNLMNLLYRQIYDWI